MEIVIEKGKRLLRLIEDGVTVFTCPAALGSQPLGAKRQSGDSRTPEGSFYICLIKETGKYGRSLGLSYPDGAAATDGLACGLIDTAAYDAVMDAQRRRVRPPWGTALGGEIYIHEGGTASDWTAGCVAVDAAAMDVIFPQRESVTSVLIRP